ncbi:response regulator transcription factor [Paenibacillus wynnii]|uniref:response regulator transcription factor n=1 Tax=Paenibacillus wynnii TaxID=268407 RepID=UPI0027931D81|nr:response regulator transcription factor [Paenibacillus wynnii]MDQ0194853.1 DNA-binding response OmpR family regulator [Paenibacillus wynnii]
MNERLVWFTPGLMKRDEEENRNQIQVVFDIGLTITTCENIEDLHEILSRIKPILLLVEVNNPKGWTGWNVISSLRKQGEIIPVMVISDEGSSIKAVWTFESGGNEYMSKPLHVGEFKCRILNLLELSGKRRGLGNLLKIDSLILDPNHRHVSREGKELKMTPKEFELLYYLAVNQENICPRDEILKKVWGYHFDTNTNVVDVYIRHIRAKVDKGYRNKLIHTVRGTGYVLRAPVNDATC